MVEAVRAAKIGGFGGLSKDYEAGFLPNRKRIRDREFFFDSNSFVIFAFSKLSPGRGIVGMS